MCCKRWEILQINNIASQLFFFFFKSIMLVNLEQVFDILTTEISSEISHKRSRPCIQLTISSSACSFATSNSWLSLGLHLPRYNNLFLPSQDLVDHLGLKP